MLAALAAATVVAVSPVKVTVTAPGHTPQVGVRWNYSVNATIGGRQVKGLITEVIVDPIGGTHPVQFGTGTKVIKNWAFKGVFRDFMSGRRARAASRSRGGSPSSSGRRSAS